MATRRERRARVRQPSAARHGRADRGGELSSAIWIGGPPGAGKTTVALRLARRHGLRWYGADTRTWQHRDRALAQGNEEARRWETLAPEQRAADERTDDELLAMSLHRERGAMVVEDLAALPARPLTVAEGTVLAASLVTEPTRAVWLLPTDDVQLERLGARGHANRLYRMLAGVIEREVEASGVQTLVVDGSLDVDQTVDAVEALLAPALAEGPRAATLAERQALLREANLAVVDQVRAFYARPWARGDGESTARTFVCECGNRRCVADVETTVAAAAAAPVRAPSH